jgi:hypothetical protein
LACSFLRSQGENAALIHATPGTSFALETPSTLDQHRLSIVSVASRPGLGASAGSAAHCALRCIWLI